jgi:hypothetical protein
MINFDEVPSDINVIVPAKGGNYCKLTEVKLATYETSEGVKGKAIDFVFVEDKLGKPEGRYRFFEPKELAICENDKERSATKAEYTKLKAIFQAFVKEPFTQEQLAPAGKEGATFDDVFKMFAGLLPVNFSDIPVKVKFVYNDKGGITLPRYKSVISSEFHPRNFEYNPQYDLLEIPAPKPKPQPAGGGMTGMSGAIGGVPSQSLF